MVTWTATEKFIQLPATWGKECHMWRAAMLWIFNPRKHLDALGWSISSNFKWCCFVSVPRRAQIKWLTERVRHMTHEESTSDGSYHTQSFLSHSKRQRNAGKFTARVNTKKQPNDSRWNGIRTLRIQGPKVLVFQTIIIPVLELLLFETPKFQSWGTELRNLGCLKHPKFLNSAGLAMLNKQLAHAAKPLQPKLQHHFLRNDACWSQSCGPSD
jgi:hypothetical protein